MAVDVVKYNFGVIGIGFLGSSIVHVFQLHADIKFYDKYKQSDTLEDVVNHADIIWMCLPTPMFYDGGEIDLSILEENLDLIHNMVSKEDNKVVIIKSTVIPGTTKYFAEKYPKLRFVMSPEFLTSRANFINSVTPCRIIIGAEDEWAGDLVEEIHRYRFNNSVLIYRTGTSEAELVKYCANNFFSVKVSYFNFVSSVCEKLGMNYEDIRDMIVSDARLTNSHTNVPGHDGKKGYSGLCFPKDINAFINYAEEIGIDPKLLKASWAQNLEDRPDHDWENIPGAVSKKK